jgi:hypothetical protein
MNSYILRDCLVQFDDPARIHHIVNTIYNVSDDDLETLKYKEFIYTYVFDQIYNQDNEFLEKDVASLRMMILLGFGHDDVKEMIEREEILREYREYLLEENHKN